MPADMFPMFVRIFMVDSCTSNIAGGCMENERRRMLIKESSPFGDISNSGVTDEDSIDPSEID
jgi:hypothetical protein